MKYGKNRPSAVFLVPFCLCILSACASTGSKAAATFTLNGMVYDHSGTAVNGMEIKLGQSHAARSDYSGRFSFPGAKSGEYALAASLQGYESFSGMIRVSSPADILYLSVFSKSDLLRCAKDSMRDGEWSAAAAYADRALAVEPGDPRALFLKALVLSSRGNPSRDTGAASAILSEMLADGVEDPSVRALLEDIRLERESPK